MPGTAGLGREVSVQTHSRKTLGDPGWRKEQEGKTRGEEGRGLKECPARYPPPTRPAQSPGPSLSALLPLCPPPSPSSPLFFAVWMAVARVGAPAALPVSDQPQGPAGGGLARAPLQGGVAPARWSFGRGQRTSPGLSLLDTSGARKGLGPRRLLSALGITAKKEKFSCTEQPGSWAGRTGRGL